MAHRDPRIDACIANAAPFAQPLLAEIRRRVHACCPEVEETIKWGMPRFLYRGKLVCGMAAFKQHASLDFWGHGDAAGNEGMGQYGKLPGLEQLPDAASFQAALQATVRWGDAAAGALLGSVSHIGLDALMHADIQPLWPGSSANPLLHALPWQALHAGCLLLAVAAGCVLAWQHRRHWHWRRR